MDTKTGKVEKAYNFLLDKIVKQEYQEGDRIIISQVAKESNVSDTPVREALRLLESEGYVTITANQGATVIGFTKEHLANIGEVKGVLEGYATRLSIDYLSPNDIRRLRAINEELRIAAENKDSARYSTLNNQFHEAIYKNTPKPTLMALIQQLWTKWRFTAQVFTVAPDRMMDSFHEHEEIIQMIEDKKYAEVENAVRNHKMVALRLWSESLPAGQRI